MKINKTDKPLAILITEKEKLQYQECNRDVTTNYAAIKRIIMEYYEQLYDDEFNKLDEMTNSFNDTSYQVMQENIENLYNPVFVFKYRFII